MNQLAQTSSLVADRSRLLHVSFVGDLSCPWSRIAFHRLERLAAEMPIELIWHAFLLSPNMPAAGVPRRAYLERTCGDVGAARGMQRRIQRIGEADGLRFEFDAIDHQPCTIRTHAWVLAADEEPDRQRQFIGMLFDSFFVDGADLGSPEVLERAALGCGLVPQELERRVRRDRFEVVRRQHQAVRVLGVDGVPAILAGDCLVAGAQPYDVLKALTETALAGAYGRQAS